MKITPVTGTTKPHYPTRRIVDGHPELLRLVPERWRGNALVISALAGVSVLVAGCRANTLSSGNTANGQARVAPIFQHGVGRGSFGCVVVNPPSFLSEEEARQVIVEEAAKAGLKFRADGAKLPAVNVPVTDRYGFARELGLPVKEDATAKKKRQEEARRIPLILDGADAQHKVYYEYVSDDDFDAWETKYLSFCTASSYDMIGTARRLRTSIGSTKPRGYHAVFYDPMVSRPMHYLGEQTASGKTDAKAEQETSEEALRKQVQDFVKWLKGQGVI